VFEGARGGYSPVDRSDRRPIASDERGQAMSAKDKINNKAEDLAGQAKEKLGKATGDEQTKNEGKADQTKSNLKDAGEKVKDAFRD
jgi:uncharacterized protein YjbJ (UPF0337 family)